MGISINLNIINIMNITVGFKLSAPKFVVDQTTGEVKSIRIEHLSPELAEGKMSEAVSVRIGGKESDREEALEIASKIGAKYPELCRVQEFLNEYGLLVVVSKGQPSNKAEAMKALGI